MGHGCSAPRYVRYRHLFRLLASAWELTRPFIMIVSYVLPWCYCGNGRRPTAGFSFRLKVRMTGAKRLQLASKYSLLSHQPCRCSSQHDEQDPVQHATMFRAALEFLDARGGRLRWLPGRSSKQAALDAMGGAALASQRLSSYISRPLAVSLPSHP